MSNRTATEVRRLVMKVMYSTVEVAGPTGAPAGVVYAALSQCGCTLQQYQALEQAMTEAGIFLKKGNLLFPIRAKAQEFGLA